MGASSDYLNAAEPRDVTVSTNSEEIPLVSQPQATEATSILVAVTQTLIDVDGRTVRNVRNDIYEITRTEYERLVDTQNYQQLVQQPGGSQTVNVQRRLTVDVDTGYTSVGSGAGNVTVAGQSTYDFETSKLGGTISCSGGKQQEYGGSAPTLNRYDYATKEWYLAAATSASGDSYTISYTYESVGADLNTPRPKFRVSNPSPSGGKDDSYIQVISYPTSAPQDNVLVAGTANIVTPDASGYDQLQQVIYKVQPNPDGSSVTTETRQVTGPEREELRYTPGTPTSLFNPKQSVLMTAAGVFRVPENLNSPFIDLYSYIQADINS